MEIAGVKGLDNYSLDGMSLVPFLQGRVPSDWRTEIYGLYDMHHGAEAHMRMVRNKDWKLVLHLEDETKNELYDLKNDLKELTNLYDEESYISVRSQLEEKLKKWMKDISADII